MDAHLEGLFASLEASFDAEVDRQENEAADDLALSLRQGLQQREFLSHRGFTVAPARGPAHVAIELGLDYVLAEGDRLFPLAACTVFLRPDLDPPISSDTGMVEALRARAEEGTEVEVVLREASIRGRLLLCGPDHVVLGCRRGEVLVPLVSVLSVRLSLED